MPGFLVHDVNGERIKYTHTAKVKRGDIVQVSNGLVLVADEDAEANAEAMYYYRGIFRVDKPTGASTNVFSKGSKVEFNASGEAIASTDADAPAVALEAAVQSDDEVLVRIK